MPSRPTVGSIEITGDEIELTGNGRVLGEGESSVAPRDPDVAVKLGADTPGPGTVDLTADELELLRGARVIVGSLSSAAPLDVTSPVSTKVPLCYARARASTCSLRSWPRTTPASVLSGSPVALEDDLETESQEVKLVGAAQVGGSVSIDTGGATLEIDGLLSLGAYALSLDGNLLFPPESALAVEPGGSIDVTGSLTLDVTGSLTLDDTELTLELPHEPVGGTHALIINDGDDLVSGTFLDLPEGALVPGSLFQVSYSTNGNDVVLSGPEIPFDIVLSKASISKSQKAGTTVGTFSTLDDDPRRRAYVRTCAGRG